MEIDAITPKRYCANETVNLVLSSFEAKSAEMNVTLCIEANLPETLLFPTQNYAPCFPMHWKMPFLQLPN